MKKKCILTRFKVAHMKEHGELMKTYRNLNQQSEK